MHDIPFLMDGKTSSFLYKTYGIGHLTLVDYFALIYLLLAAVAGAILLSSYFVKQHHE